MVIGDAMRIALGCDHAGFPLKQVLAEALDADGHQLLDLGTFSTDPVDYPDFARAVGHGVIRGFVEVGVLVCGSGVGASIAANKLRGVRAALCHDVFTARQSREDDNANVLCLGARVLDEATALEIARAWLAARFSGEERHVRRLQKVEQLEASTGGERPLRAAGIAMPSEPARLAAPAVPRPAEPARRAAEPTPHAAEPAAAPPARPAPSPPPVPPPIPPVAPRTPEPPRPRPPDPLAARAAELIRQFSGLADEEGGGKKQAATPADEEEESIEVISFREPPRPAAVRPGPAPRDLAPPPRPPVREPAAVAGPRAPEPRAAPAEPPEPPRPPKPPPPPLRDALRMPPVEEALAQLEAEDFGGRLWLKDALLWPGEVTDIRNRLGWLTSPAIMREHTDELRSLATEIARLNFTHAVLIGMGGASLTPEVLNHTFGAKMGFPDLVVLDSTDPGAVRHTLRRIDIARALFVVSTKSGATTETGALYEFFRAQVETTKPSKPGLQFVAITDPGSPLEAHATEAGFRRTFLNPAAIGGRYSALSFFGLVPAALIGIDLRALLERAAAMVEACGPEVPLAEHPGARLGAALAGFARAGRDKVTLVLSEKIASLGGWIEQLLAESLGKAGKGLVPVDGEPLGPSAVYGDDRLFVAVLLEGDDAHDADLARLDAAGHPVIRLTLKDAFDVGAEFFRWEVATASAGAILGVNPFDEPDVTSAKERTVAVLGEWRRTRRLPGWPIAAEAGPLALLAPGGQPPSLADGLRAHLAQVRPGDYVAILPYLHPGAETSATLQGIRVALRDRLRVATTVGYGPRYLHSTGQLHKGGPPTGVFLQITGDDGEDLPVPGAGYGFSTLKGAQAQGDLEALAAAGRRVVRVHLRGKTGPALEALDEQVKTAVRRQE